MLLLTIKIATGLFGDQVQITTGNSAIRGHCTVLTMAKIRLVILIVK